MSTAYAASDQFFFVLVFVLGGFFATRGILSGIALRETELRPVRRELHFSRRMRELVRRRLMLVSMCGARSPCQVAAAVRMECRCVPKTAARRPAGAIRRP
jgi:hypothetical protein